MNLLPKCHEDFSKEDYWNSFFSKRGKKAFEWYGEYPELCGQLSKFIKTKDDVLVVGCGNSKLSLDLHDVGYDKITSVDISKVVIDQMKDDNKIDRPNLIFEQMDATAMTYPDGKFSVVLDKGTLDALMPNSNPETLATIDKYFNEISRVLRRGGRYICVSLLQEHILRKLISYFPTSHFMFRVTRCYEAENKTRETEGSSLPVFVVMATKFPDLSQQVLELALTGDAATRAESTDEVVNAVLSVQQSALVCDRLQKKSVADVGEITLDLYAPGNDKPRYTIYVLDQPKSLGKTYVAFLVPQGRDMYWLFGTKEGRKEFAETMEKDRTAIIALRRNHNFKDWDQVKAELSPVVKNLAPPRIPPNSSIPFWSLGPDVGQREVVWEGDSAINGRIMIEDVSNDEDDFKQRRLIFMSNEFVVQSEARIKKEKSRRGKLKEVVEFGVLGCEHHAFMSVALNAAIGANTAADALVVGLGGGGLCMFLHKILPKLRLTAVEIDETIVQVAKNWFHFVVDNQMKVDIADGLIFLKDAAEEGTKYDAILFDVGGSDTALGLSCPPKEFLECEILNCVEKCLNDNGLFVLNLVCRDRSLRPKILEDLKTIFSSVVTLKIHKIVNEIIVCSRVKKTKEIWLKEFKESGENLNDCVMSKKLLTDKIVKIEDILNNLNVEL